MKILITGATGFVGSWLTKYLVEKNHDVRVIKRSPGPIEDLKNLPIEIVQGDVTDQLSLNKAAQGVDSVFHLAGVVAYKKAQRKLMDAVNVVGTQNIINSCKKNNVRRLVHFSSVSAVGASFNPNSLINEESEFNIHHLNLGYFESKHDAEKLVKSATDNGEIDSVIVNPATIYGAGDAKKGSRGFQLKVAKGKFPFYPPGGVNVIAIEDVLKATYAAWEKGRKGERYILSGTNLLIKDLFRLVAENAGVPAPNHKLPKHILLAVGKIGDAMESVGLKGPMSSENAWASVLFHWYDNSKAKRELGLDPIPAETAIKNSIDWVKQNGLI